MIYRVFREYAFSSDRHVGIFETEAEALAAANADAEDTSAALVVIEEPFGAYAKGRELHRFGGKL